MKMEKDLCNIDVIKEILNRYGFHSSRALGQNFLISGWVPEQVAEASGADQSTGVVEIGPGVGCLTRELALRAGAVLAVELDKRLMPVLQETVGAFENVKLMQGDILKLELETITAEQLSGLRLSVCANIPYNITSPIIVKLIDSGLFNTITVMVQREAAQRIAAGPGSKDYGAFSVFCQLTMKPELLFDVPPECFAPRPKVTSSVVRLTRREEPTVQADKELFFRTVRGAFGQRRKTLVNSLASAFPELRKERITDAAAACGLDSCVRGEMLSLEEFDALSRALGEALR